MFYAVSMIAAGLAFHPWTLPVSAGSLLFWWFVFSLAKPARKRLFLRSFVILILGISIFGVLPTAQVNRSNPASTNCRNKIRQLSLGMWTFESTLNELPPAFEADADGKPMHSWRVLILPFIEATLPYDFDEPWDGPNNIKLLNQMPEIYRCPSNPSPTKTVYKLVTGQGTAFENGRMRKIDDIIDGTSNTIMIIEDHSNPVPWTKPDDLTVEEAIKILSAMPEKESAHPRIRSQPGLPSHTGFNNVAFFDGSVESISFDADPGQVRAACMIADGTIIESRGLGGRPTCPDRTASAIAAKAIALVAYLVLLLTPWAFMYRPRKKIVV